jgi:DNA transformation protein and related proteins
MGVDGAALGYISESGLSATSGARNSGFVHIPPNARAGRDPCFTPFSRENMDLTMRDPDNLTAFLLELLAPLGPVAARRMFGGVGLFHTGMMFGLIVRDELFFKVSDANRPRYEAAGEAPFSYDTKHGVHTLQSYWRCPPELLDDPEIFQDWARQAVEVAAAAARGKKPPRKRTAPP